MGHRLSWGGRHACRCENAKFIREAGLEATCQGFVYAQITGTPEQIIEQVKARKEILGDFELLIAPLFGGMPVDLATESLKVTSTEVLPAVRHL